MTIKAENRNKLHRQRHELTEFQGELKERSAGDVIRKRWTKWAEENGVDAGSGALE